MSTIDHVIGVFPREALSAALAATHRGGFGPQTRVFDGARTSAMRQLARAGLRILEGHQLPAEAILIVVTAPGRTAIVIELFRQLGSESVHLAARHTVSSRATRPEETALPDIRIAESSAAGTDA